MSDKAVLNIRERPLSTDIMLMQLISGRLLADSLKYLLASQFAEETIFTDPVQSLPQPIAVGLNMVATTGGSSVTVRAGALFFDSASVPVTAAANDTTYRIGLNRADATVSLPAAGGSNRALLLTASMQEVVAVSETRDIMDAGTAHFEPTLVPKLTEFRVSFSWTAGAGAVTGLPTIPAVPAGQVPIGVVLQSATGQVLSGSIIDLRPTLAKRGPGAHRQNYFSKPRSSLTTLATPDTRSWFFKLSVAEAYGSQGASTEQGGGLKLHWGPLGASLPSVDMSSAAYQEPSIVIAPSTWYYVYLAPWGDWAPGNLGTTIDAAGVLVVSANGPNENGYNASVLNLPAPYSIYPCAAGRAPCVGMLRSNPQGTGLAPMTMQDGVINMSTDSIVSNRVAYSDNNILNTGNPKTIPVPPNAFPANTKFVRLHADVSYSPPVLTAPENFYILAYVQGQSNPSAGSVFPMMGAFSPSVDTEYVESTDLDIHYPTPTGVAIVGTHSGPTFTLTRMMDVRILEIRV